MLETAIAFYHQVLTSTSLGKPALDYLRGRGFTDATIETFQLGWAPDNWDSMSRKLVEKRERPARGARGGRGRLAGAIARRAASA